MSIQRNKLLASALPQSPRPNSSRCFTDKASSALQTKAGASHYLKKVKSKQRSHQNAGCQNIKVVGTPFGNMNLNFSKAWIPQNPENPWIHCVLSGNQADHCESLTSIETSKIMEMEASKISCPRETGSGKDTSLSKRAQCVHTYTHRARSQHGR